MRRIVMKWQLFVSLMLMQIHFNNQNEIGTPILKSIFKILQKEMIANAKKDESVTLLPNEGLSAAAILNILSSPKVIEALADNLANKVIEKLPIENFLNANVKDSVERFEIIL